MMSESKGSQSAGNMKEQEEEEQLNPQDACPLCLCVLHAPVTTPCAHSFCAWCYSRWAAMPSSAISTPLTPAVNRRTPGPTWLASTAGASPASSLTPQGTQGAVTTNTSMQNREGNPNARSAGAAAMLNPSSPLPSAPLPAVAAGLPPTLPAPAPAAAPAAPSASPPRRSGVGRASDEGTMDHDIRHTHITGYSSPTSTPPRSTGPGIAPIPASPNIPATPGAVTAAAAPSGAGTPAYGSMHNSSSIHVPGYPAEIPVGHHGRSSGGVSVGAGGAVPWVSCPLCRAASPGQLPPDHDKAAQLAACYPALYTCRGAEQAAEQAEAARCVTVQRTLVVGNTHELVREGEASSAGLMGNVHRWLFFVRVEAGGHDVSEEVLDTVTVYLHPTFRPSTLVLRQPPYAVARRGWGIFIIRAELSFKPAWRHDPVVIRWLLDFDGPGSMLEAQLDFVRMLPPPAPQPHAPTGTQPHTHAQQQRPSPSGDAGGSPAVDAAGQAHAHAHGAAALTARPDPEQFLLSAMPVAIISSHAPGDYTPGSPPRTAAGTALPAAPATPAAAEATEATASPPAAAGAGGSRMSVWGGRAAASAWSPTERSRQGDEPVAYTSLGMTHGSHDEPVAYTSLGMTHGSHDEPVAYTSLGMTHGSHGQDTQGAALLGVAGPPAAATTRHGPGPVSMRMRQASPPPDLPGVHVGTSASRAAGIASQGGGALAATGIYPPPASYVSGDMGSRLGHVLHAYASPDDSDAAMDGRDHRATERGGGGHVNDVHDSSGDEDDSDGGDGGGSGGDGRAQGYCMHTATEAADLEMPTGRDDDIHASRRIGSRLHGSHTGMQGASHNHSLSRGNGSGNGPDDDHASMGAGGSRSGLLQDNASEAAGLATATRPLASGGLKRSRPVGEVKEQINT